MSAYDTYFDTGPTFFSHTGTSSKIDHICGPEDARPLIEKCYVAHGVGRLLQAISDPRPRDHYPLVMRMRYQLQHSEPGEARL
eukprot:2774655-Lingulodinium_polyedra.AAC.1